jgi:hypothetical protein
VRPLLDQAARHATDPHPDRAGQRRQLRALRVVLGVAALAGTLALGFLLGALLAQRLGILP